MKYFVKNILITYSFFLFVWKYYFVDSFLEVLIMDIDKRWRDSNKNIAGFCHNIEHILHILSETVASTEIMVVGNRPTPLIMWICILVFSILILRFFLSFLSPYPLSIIFLSFPWRYFFTFLFFPPKFQIPSPSRSLGGGGTFITPLSFF